LYHALISLFSPVNQQEETDGQGMAEVCIKHVIDKFHP